MAGRPKDDMRDFADEELMTLLERQDPDAFAVLYDRHGAVAYSLAYRMVGDRPTAEDVTQEAFLSIWRSRARFDVARGSVRSWILSIVRHRAIDTLRRAGGGRPKLDHDDDETLLAQAAPDSTDAEAIRRETSHRVRGALATLPAEQSEVISLAYFGGFTHAEIAEMLGAPLGTVKGRMRLGLEKTRALIAEGLGVEHASEVLP